LPLQCINGSKKLTDGELTLRMSLFAVRAESRMRCHRTTDCTGWCSH